MAPHHRNSGYLPGFDGWRAIAILGVIMAHDELWRAFGYSDQHVRSYGGYGVYLFFAISGVLICWRILEDEAKQGHFRLGDFYIRRFFRIQPAAWAYLGTLAVLMLLGLIHERWHFWLGALFLYQNFTWHGFQMSRMLKQGWFTGHFWTLAVEEQFYILLSTFMVLFKRWRTLLMAMVLAIFFVWQTMAKHRHLWSLDHSERRIYWVLPFLLWPAFWALLLRKGVIKHFLQRFLQPWVAFLVTLLAVAGNQIHYSGVHSLSLWRSLSESENVLLACFTLWVVSTMLHPLAWTTRFLELAPVRYLGRLSYSIYLWHLLFFSTTTLYPGIHWAPLVFLGQRPWRYFGALGMALLSYHLLEKPMIRLGHRLAPPATPGHADLRGDLQRPTAGYTNARKAASPPTLRA